MDPWLAVEALALYPVIALDAAFGELVTATVSYLITKTINKTCNINITILKF